LELRGEQYDWKCFQKSNRRRLAYSDPESEVEAAAEANEYNKEKANFISFIVPK
jgi:hypothetical protein